MTIRQIGGVFGRNPEFNDADIKNDLTVGNDLSVGGTADINSIDVTLGSVRLDGSHPVGTDNTALGNGALANADASSSRNVAIGRSALTSSTTGYHNVAIGYRALASLSTSTRSVAVGYNSQQIATGGYNTSVGWQAMNGCQDGQFNAAFGTEALSGVSSGNNNTAFGYRAANTLTTGSNNIVIGHNAQPSSGTVSNETTIGSGTTQSVRIFGSLTQDLAFASGNGIDFSATSGTGTSELFDDYEEGTWTPVLYGTTTAGTQTYTWQRGTYTKIGNRVIADFTILIGTKDVTTAGQLEISGLPFTVNVNAGIPQAAFAFRSNMALQTNAYYHTAQPKINTATIILGQSGSTVVNTSDLNFANGSQMVGSVQYYV